MKKFVLVAAFLFLSACAQQKLQEANRQAREMADECKSKYESHELKSCAAFARCSNAAFDKMTEAGYPFPDLIQYSKASRVALCKKVDQGKLSKEDAALQMSKIGIEITAEEMRRLNAQSQADSARTQSMGAAMQGLGVYQNSIQPRNGVSCIQQGPFFNCR